MPKLDYHFFIHPVYFRTDSSVVKSPKISTIYIFKLSKKLKKNIDCIAMVDMTRAKCACVLFWYNLRYFMLTQSLEIKARGC